MFGEGVGLLEGEYHIQLKEDAVPVQHAPCRVPVALRDRLRNTLDEMVQQDIVAPVTQPTPWISSVVVVPKKNGTLRVCLDLKDLNKAIEREHYLLPTIEDIAPRLYESKLFSILEYAMVSGKSNWIHLLLSSPPSTHPLGDTAGRGCPLEYAQLQRYSSVACMS